MVEDSGRCFEDRALAIARAIHDPGGLQGSVMVDGSERDAVFVSDTSIVAFEFTQQTKKDKAVHDGKKLAGLLNKLSKDPANRFKSLQGYFVTEQEPTADQRAAVEQIAKDAGVPLKAMGVGVLRRQLIDAEEYLRVRLEAPFGSTGFKIPSGNGQAGSHYVEPRLIDAGPDQWSVDSIGRHVDQGRSMVISADFGAGKSALLHQVFLRLRKLYFKNVAEQRLPVHVNLRECYGLKSPAEVLRRHAEEIGFTNERSLIAAWRSGAVTLLLDGFDEIVPARWSGGARDLKSVRWQALEPVRRLVMETPEGSGVLIAGRPQYFSERSELLQTLGLEPGTPVATLDDFDERRAGELIGKDEVRLPSWVPTRPLLLRFLAGAGLVERLQADANYDEAAAWVDMLDFLSIREADRVATVTPERVRALISRVATLARTTDGTGQPGSGGVSVQQMRDAFKEVCAVEPDEEGIQLLLRLPGLASNGERRTFVDAAFAEAAYGLDLATYASAPYSAHPLSSGVSWAANTGRLASAVAAAELSAQNFEPGYVSVAIGARLDQDLVDAVTFDLLGVADANEVAAPSGTQPYFRELLVTELTPGRSDSYLAKSIFRDCVIDVLDLEDVDSVHQIPLLAGCLIAHVSGYSVMPSEFESKLSTSEFFEFEAPSETTAAILDLAIGKTDRIALVVLKKVYIQAGAGRKLSALSRGLPLADRPLVSDVVSSLIAAGLLLTTSRKTDTLVLPVKGRMAEVRKFIENPHSFSLSSL